MSRWTVVLLIHFRIAYHIMSVTVLGWRNGHGPMISYPMIIMIISHPFPPHHPIPRKVINLGELDSQRVVDGLQKISQFLDSYEKERSAELLEGVLDLLSPWLLIFPEILYLGNLYESIGNTEYVLLFWGFLGKSKLTHDQKPLTWTELSTWKFHVITVFFNLTKWLWPAIPSLRIVKIVPLRLELRAGSHWRLARWLAAGSAFAGFCEETGEVFQWSHLSSPWSTWRQQ